MCFFQEVLLHVTVAPGVKRSQKSCHREMAAQFFIRRKFDAIKIAADFSQLQDGRDFALPCIGIERLGRDKLPNEEDEADKRALRSKQLLQAPFPVGPTASLCTSLLLLLLLYLIDCNGQELDLKFFYLLYFPQRIFHCKTRQRNMNMPESFVLDFLKVGLSRLRHPKRSDRLGKFLRSSQP